LPKLRKPCIYVVAKKGLRETRDTIMNMDVRTLFERIKPLFEQHKNDEHVEFEFRLGKFNCGTFDTDVGKQRFELVLDGLRQYPGWEQIVSINEEVFYRESDNLRISIDSTTGDEKIVKKERVHNEDFEKLRGAPYDVRFGISKETPVEDYEGEMDKKKNKYRLSFIRKNLSIDMTIINGDVEDMDTEDPNRYQIEFEIIDPKLVTDDNTLFNIIHKIKDVFNILDSNK
jgi:hypothetical protein